MESVNVNGVGNTTKIKDTDKSSILTPSKTKEERNGRYNEKNYSIIFSRTTQKSIADSSHSHKKKKSKDKDRDKEKVRKLKLCPRVLTHSLLFPCRNVRNRINQMTSNTRSTPHQRGRAIL